MTEELLARITRTPGVRGGKPCIRGFRITVHDMLGYFADGLTRDEILGYFPFLTEADIQACLAYAEDTPGVPARQSALTPS